MKTPVVVGAGLLLALVAAPAEAQDLRLGIELGMSLSGFHFERSGDGSTGLDEHRNGVVAGATAAYRLGARVGLESGVFWVQKGARGALQGFEEPIDTDVRLSYVQVPLLLRVTPFPRLPARLSLAAGPRVSFETGCSMDQGMSSAALVVGCYAPRATTDVGFLFGTGVAWPVGAAELMLEVRYDLGLRDIDTTGTLDTRNRGLTLAPRLSIPVGG